MKKLLKSEICESINSARDLLILLKSQILRLKKKKKKGNADVVRAIQTLPMYNAHNLLGYRGEEVRGQSPLTF